MGSSAWEVPMVAFGAKTNAHLIPIVRASLSKIQTTFYLLETAVLEQLVGLMKPADANSPDVLNRAAIQTTNSAKETLGM